jgi:hypothetical protein
VGGEIRNYYTAWRAACKCVGNERIPHDFRRTAVRNFERAGVPRTTAMAMVGHKTESIYRRYSIVDQAMLEVGASKLDQLQQAQGLSKPVVVSITRKRRPAEGVDGSVTHPSTTARHPNHSDKLPGTQMISEMR